MPGRLLPLVTNEIYHVFNRGINRQPTFSYRKDYQRALQAIEFYHFISPPVRLSKFLTLEKERQIDILKAMKDQAKLVEIFAYCLMPNHFHLLLKQTKENGIAKFLSNFQNSYTRYFNTRHGRDGSLFLDQFKAVRLETDEQFIHVSRYIHLNPHTGFIVKTLGELENYPWSSFPTYLQSKNTNLFVETSFLVGMFGTRKSYRKFVFDQADYQRQIKLIEHLVLD